MEQLVVLRRGRRASEDGFAVNQEKAVKEEEPTLCKKQNRKG